MKKIMAFSDIDGTLIHKISPEAMETFNKESDSQLINVSNTRYGSSYMTKKDNILLQKLDNKIELVLITSRGYESYKNINLGFSPKHVLLEGGSVLFTDNNKDEQWNYEIKSIIKSEHYLFNIIKKEVCKLGYDIKFKTNEYLLDFVDNEYLRTKNLNNKKQKFENAYKKLCENEEIKNNFNIYCYSNGVFIVHKKLEKGEMIKKYIDKFKGNQSSITVSMGDSKTDSTMFNLTDYSFGLKGFGAKNEYSIFESISSKMGFTSFILQGIEDIIKKEEILCL